MKNWMLVTFIIFNLNFGDVYNLKILEMKVPLVADPRNELLLSCKFDMNGQKLYSVKWYKDEQEFFRYLPLSKPSDRFFKVLGVHLSNVNCNQEQCDVLLDQLSTTTSSGSYRCEISLDAPTFRIAFETRNLTVAALGDEDPQLTGVSSSYMLGDLITAVCTSAPSDPAAIVTWFVNGKQVSRIEQGEPRTKQDLMTGLMTRSVSLSFHAQKIHFPPPGYVMEMRCVATSPVVVGHTKSSSFRAHLTTPSLTVRNQKLEWATNKGTCTSNGFYFLVALMLVWTAEWSVI